MKKQIDKELRQNILDLLYIVPFIGPEITYSDQEFYVALLPLLFNTRFRNRIKELREQLKIPQDWYGKLRDDVGADGTWEDWVDARIPDVPKEPSHKLIIELSAEFDLDPLSYGMFLLDYLYFSCIDIESINSREIVAKEEFKHKARIVIQGGGRINQTKKDNKIFAYIQIYKDTTPTGIEEFYRKNEKTIIGIQKYLDDYPIDRVRNVKTFTREVEVFLFDALGYNARQIANILSNAPDPEVLENFRKENEDYFAELPSLSHEDKVVEIISTRKDKEIYELSDSDVRTIVSNFKKDLLIADA
ncbi:MAG TPA: hypothetical protein VGT05_02575 [Patescibacteria group bacterium]|nr:hypothetical protein [Patescibacteria group bacterium]